MQKMHLTMMISSSSYPKFIYGMPLFEKMTKIRFEFEFKFNFDLNQKRKKNKRKRGTSHKGWLRLKRPNLTATGPSGQAHSAETRATEKKEEMG